MSKSFSTFKWYGAGDDDDDADDEGLWGLEAGDKSDRGVSVAGGT